MKKPIETNNEGMPSDTLLPKTFTRLIGLLLLCIAVGMMSLWGVFA